MSAPTPPTRALSLLLLAQALFVASPITTLDNLLTAPRAVGAQAARADLAATVTSGLPFVTSLVALTLFLLSFAVRRSTSGVLVTAGVFSAIGLTAALVPALRDATFAADVLRGIPLGLAAVASIVLVIRVWPARTHEKQPRKFAHRTTAVIAVFVVGLAGIGAFSQSIPSAPISALLANDREFRTSEPTTQFDGTPPAQNPFLAVNPNSNIHHDGAMTDAYVDRGVLDPRKAQVLRRHLGGVCASVMFDSAGRLVAVCVNPTSVTLNVLDHEERVVLPTADGRITRWSISNSAGEPKIALIDEFDVSSFLAPEEGINSTLPDATGDWWIVGQLGSVGVLDTDTGRVHGMRFEDADIENSFAVARDGGAYVVTSRELVFLDIEAGKPVVVWRESYDQGSRRKPGQTSRASGTTPTLFPNEQLVAITDNADPRMNVLVYDTSPELAEGDREVCRVPVFADGKSASDNSLIAMGSSLFVENNYGYNLLTATNGRSSEPGLVRIDVDHEQRSCAAVWENDEIRIPSVVSKGSSTGVLVSYTRDHSLWGIDAWYFTAVDAETGEVMWRVRSGSGPMVNNHYAATYLGPDGSIYTGATGGIVALASER